MNTDDILRTYQGYPMPEKPAEPGWGERFCEGVVLILTAPLWIPFVGGLLIIMLAPLWVPVWLFFHVFL
jgi:hypothetical protein